MEIICQRCHESLRDSDRYCPVCGLPQLMYVAADMPERTSEEQGDAEGARSGLPTVVIAGELAGGIAWRPALRSALQVGVPAGVLCSELTSIGAGLSLFWMVTAAAWAVSLYVKRTQQGRVSLRSGARIGLVTGLLASWLTLAVNGAYLWVERFVMHQGTQMDAMWLAQVEASLQLNQQMISQFGMAAEQATQFQQTWRAMTLSPEGHAGLALWGMIAGAAFLTTFAMLGGMVGARFLAPRGRVGAQR